MTCVVCPELVSTKTRPNGEVHERLCEKHKAQQYRYLTHRNVLEADLAWERTLDAIPGIDGTLLDNPHFWDEATRTWRQRGAA